MRLLIVSCALSFVICCASDVGVAGNNRNNGRQFFARQQRVQRLEAVDPTPYPEVGFRPQRPFGLPTDQATVNTFNFPPLDAQSPAFNPAVFSANNNDNINNENFDYNDRNNFAATPDALYGAPLEQPARLRQFQSRRLQQQEPVQFARSRFPAARLTDERDEREVIQESPNDIEVDVKQAAETIPVNQPAAAAAPPMSTIAYFPAGAVGFVKPFPNTFTASAFPAVAAPAVAAPTYTAAAITAPEVSTPAAGFVQYQNNIGEVPFSKILANPAHLPVLQYQKNVQTAPVGKLVANPAQLPVVQYQGHLESVPLFAKYITSPAQLPFSAQYYTTSSYVPQTFNYATPAAQLQAW